MYQFKFIIILIITFLANSILYGKKEHREIDSEFSNEISTELDLTNVKDKCAVKISNIVDIRRDKKTVGKYRKRAVIINNSDQFLKSIVKSFETRNIDLIMPSQNNPSKVIVPEINLVKIWVSRIGSNAAVNIIFKMTFYDNSVRIYRGNNSRRSFLRASSDKIQKAVDISIANVLDKMAVDLHKACGNEVTLKK